MEKQIQAMVNDAILDFTNDGWETFTREDVMSHCGHDPSECKNPATWATAIGRCADANDNIDLMPYKAENWTGRRALNVYFIRSNAKGIKTGPPAGDAETADPSDPVVDYTMIGRAVCEQIVSLSDSLAKVTADSMNMGSEITGLKAELETRNREKRVLEVKLGEAQASLKKQNQTVISLNERIRVLERTAPAADGGENKTFKLSEVAKIKTG